MTDDEWTWAVVETHKGVQDVFSYRGRLARADLEAWRKGELQGALTIRDLYWLESEGGKIVPHVVGRRGEFRNATGTLHVAASTIVVVMELRAPEAGVMEEEPGPVLRLAPSRPPPASDE